jgi:hypothetical protein
MTARTAWIKLTHFFPWQIWLGMLIAIPLGAGWAAFTLLSQPELLECRNLDNAEDTGSARLYCAQAIASRSGDSDLAEAIRMAETVPTDHPLSPSRDRLLAQWSARLMELAEVTYQEGNVEEATNLARQVSVSAPVYATVDDRIRYWQDTWKKAEAIYAKAEAEIDNEKNSEALQTARELLSVDNRYWQTTRYQELAERIESARIANSKNEEQDKKGRLANRSLGNGRTLIAGRKLLTTEELMGKWEQEQEQRATAQLNKARDIARVGDPKTLQYAVRAAEQVTYGTPQYEEAQQLIQRWKQQIQTVEDRPYLERATQLANRGDAASLQAAIDEASRVYYGRSLYPEAQSQINQWNERLQQLQATPNIPIPPPTRATETPSYRPSAVDPAPSSAPVVPVPTPTVAPLSPARPSTEAI